MHYGLQFCNIDLHVHTPASECFIEPDVSPQMIVDQAINVGLKAIAITDHNSARWVDKVNQAVFLSNENEPTLTTKTRPVG